MKFSHIADTLYILLHSVPTWYTNKILTEKLALSFLIPVASLLVVDALEVQDFTWEGENESQENLSL